MNGTNGAIAAIGHDPDPAEVEVDRDEYQRGIHERLSVLSERQQHTTEKLVALQETIDRLVMKLVYVCLALGGGGLAASQLHSLFGGG